MIKRTFLTLSGFSPAVMDNGNHGPAIIFLHGNSLNSETYYHQFNDKNLSGYRLVAIDFPGHGASPAANDPSAMYNLLYFRDLIARIIEQLNLHSYIVVGHSLGGHVAMELLQTVKRCKGLFLTGAPPARLPLDTSQLFQADERVGLLFKPALSPIEAQSLASLLTCGKHQQQVSSWLTATDPAFRENFPVSLGAGLVSDEFILLRDAEVPFALVQGENDPLINAVYLDGIRLNNLWQGKVITIKDACHLPQVENPLAFNAILDNFIRSYLNSV
jgi:pimeloyl-ACP methyl ester carboxylesterase